MDPMDTFSEIPIENPTLEDGYGKCLVLGFIKFKNLK